MKKLILYLLILCLSLVLFIGCTPMNMNNVVKEPNFRGIVEEVHENSILVRVDEDQDLSTDLLVVSLDLKLKDSIRDFQVGQEVKVYYDGKIAESYPGQVNTVYAIILTEPKEEKKQIDLEKSQMDKLNNFDSVFMTIKEDSLSPNGVTLILENKSDQEATYGDYFLIEEKIGDQWYQSPVVVEGDYGFHDIGYGLMPGETKEHQEDWQWLYGSLEAGHYRIIKNILDFRGTGDFTEYFLGVEFEIE